MCTGEETEAQSRKEVCLETTWVVLERPRSLPCIANTAYPDHCLALPLALPPTWQAYFLGKQIRFSSLFTLREGVSLVSRECLAASRLS